MGEKLEPVKEGVEKNAAQTRGELDHVDQKKIGERGGKTLQYYNTKAQNQSKIDWLFQNSSDLKLNAGFKRDIRTCLFPSACQMIRINPMF